MPFLLLLLFLFQQQPQPQPDAGYLLETDDVVDVSVFDHADLSSSAQVSSTGMITLPLIGPIRAVGLDTYTLAKDIEIALKKDVLINPHVTVSIKQAASQQITLAGGVKSPGVYPIRRAQPLLETISKAGGLAESAGPVILITRPGKGGAEPRVISIDVEELYEKGEPAANVPLQGGDRISVPRVDPIVVNGEVKKPGELPARFGKSLPIRDVILQSQGLTDRADSVILINRNNLDGRSKPEIVTVSVEDLFEKRKPEANVAVFPGDVVMAPASLPILVLGEVKKPGDLAVRLGKPMLLRDVLQQSNGLTDRAGGVIRITPRDQSAENDVRINVEDLLDKRLAAANVEVHPGDVVTVAVGLPISVGGEVKKPADVITRKGLPVREVIQQGGGLTERAGGIIRITRTPAGGNGAAAEPVVVSIGVEDLLEKWKPEANVDVYPGDTVTVAPGPPISVIGEVRKPGDIPTRLGKPAFLRDLIQQSGGVTEKVGGTVRITHFPTGLPGSPTTPQVVSIAIEDLIDRWQPEANVSVFPGDTVNVLAAMPIVTIGELRKPLEIPTRAGKGLSLQEAVMRSGGPTKDADKRQGLIIRARADGSSDHIPVSLEKFGDPAFPDQTLLPNDVLYVPAKVPGVMRNVMTTGLSIAVAAATQRAITLGR